MQEQLGKLSFFKNAHKRKAWYAYILIALELCELVVLLLPIETSVMLPILMAIQVLHHLVAVSEQLIEVSFPTRLGEDSK